jgi:thymidylate synthase
LIAAELLFFLSGSSNVADLQKQKVHIWDQNANSEGRAGFYSQAWRYFGANHFSHDKREMERQPHVDQIADVIHKIQHDSTSRRILISSWDALNIHMNPSVLPPCHNLMQFYVRNDGTLDMQVYQRSADVAIG